jgi:hypothetical protein
VRAFDPEGLFEARQYLTDVVFADDAYDCAAGADLLVILTEWDQFRRLDWERLRAALKDPLVVDLRNLYQPEEMKARGFHYFSLGRPNTRLEMRDGIRGVAPNGAARPLGPFEPWLGKQLAIRPAPADVAVASG